MKRTLHALMLAGAWMFVSAAIVTWCNSFEPVRADKAPATVAAPPPIDEVCIGFGLTCDCTTCDYLNATARIQSIFDMVVQQGAQLDRIEKRCRR